MQAVYPNHCTGNESKYQLSERADFKPKGSRLNIGAIMGIILIDLVLIPIDLRAVP